MAPILRRTQAWLDMMRQHYATYGGRRPRSAAGAIFPHLDTNSPTLRAANQRPKGSVASQIYPHLPTSASTRVQQPKPRPRQSIARRLYGSLE
jgi:hypothetical protein